MFSVTSQLPPRSRYYYDSNFIGERPDGPSGKVAASERQPGSKLGADHNACALSPHLATCLPAHGEAAHTAGPLRCPPHPAGRLSRLRVSVDSQGPQPPQLVWLPPRVPQQRRRGPGILGESETCPVSFHGISHTHTKNSATSCLIKSSLFKKGFIINSNNCLYKQNDLGQRFSKFLVSRPLHNLKNYWGPQNFYVGYIYQCLPCYKLKLRNF